MAVELKSVINSFAFSPLQCDIRYFDADSLWTCIDVGTLFENFLETHRYLSSGTAKEELHKQECYVVLSDTAHLLNRDGI
jgi:hypothetical protein